MSETMEAISLDEETIGMVKLEYVLDELEIFFDYFDSSFIGQSTVEIIKKDFKKYCPHHKNFSCDYDVENEKIVFKLFYSPNETFVVDLWDAGITVTHYTSNDEIKNKYVPEVTQEMVDQYLKLIDYDEECQGNNSYRELIDDVAFGKVKISHPTWVDVVVMSKDMWSVYENSFERLRNLKSGEGIKQKPDFPKSSFVLPN